MFVIKFISVFRFIFLAPNTDDFRCKYFYIFPPSKLFELKIPHLTITLNCIILNVSEVSSLLY